MVSKSLKLFTQTKPNRSDRSTDTTASVYCDTDRGNPCGLFGVEGRIRGRGSMEGRIRGRGSMEGRIRGRYVTIKIHF